MRPSGRSLAVTALVLALVSGQALGQSEEPVLSGPGDPGGGLTVSVPEGAAAPGATITVVPRDPTDRPEDLMAVPMEWTYYELQPSDVPFEARVTVTRAIGFEELGIDRFDPVFDGLIVGSLFTRDAGGTWSWLADAEVRLDLEDAAFTVEATTDHGGPIIAVVAGDLLIATEDDASTTVGQTFRVEGQLRVDPESRADVAAVSARTSDEAIATEVRSYDVEGFDRAVGVEFECLAPGTVEYEATFPVTGAADVGPLADAVGLAGADIAVIHTGEHICE